MSEITLNILLHGSNCTKLLTHFIAYDKHQCTFHFLCIAENDYSNNCISHFIAMCQDVRNHIKHIITWF